MIDFTNLQSPYPVSRAGAGARTGAGKKGGAPAAGAGGPENTDVVEISADAALKGKLSAFSSVLAKELAAASPERIARLKEEYAGDACPVNGIDVARAIFTRSRIEDITNE